MRPKHWQWQLKYPGLQREPSQLCVTCGRRADCYCARCGLTPYCSVGCQRRDWQERHRGVCHNLGRLLQAADGVTDSMDNAAPPPLRRPRSPVDREPPRQRGSSEHSGSDKQPNKPFDAGRGGRAARGRCFAPPRNGEMRRPNAHDPPRDDATNPHHGASGANNISSRFNNTEGAGRNEDRAPVPKPAANPPASREPPRPAIMSPPEVSRHQHQQAAARPPANTEVKPVEAKAEIKPIFNKADAMPVKKIIPKNCVVETLSVGDAFILSVDAPSSDCRVSTPGFVGVSMHDSVAAVYGELCEPFSVACEAEDAAYDPTPGDAFAYCSAEDGAWWRARCVAPGVAALVDCARVVTMGGADRARRLPPAFVAQPEYSCFLQYENVGVGKNYRATIQARTPAGFKVALADAESGAPVGDGGWVSRWLPAVEPPKPRAQGPGAPAGKAAPEIPEVGRPDVRDNMKVFLVDATALGRVFVRPCDMASQRAFDATLQEVALHGLKAKRLAEVSTGAIVISKFTDDTHYRALVKRINKEKNKYQLEYLEYGNIHVNTLENLYECPPELGVEARPVVTSMVALGADTPLTPLAEQYVEPLKDTAEMLLSLPSGEPTAPSGSPVTLTVMKKNLNLNRKLQELCTPEWRKIEERGGDVLETEPLMYSSLEYVALPAGGCELTVLDSSMLHGGMVNGCPRDLPPSHDHTKRLRHAMAEYCNSDLGRDPYLPNDEELCIARMPDREGWFRAVKIKQKDGPGGRDACVLYIDSGTIVPDLPVSDLRKMLPEFLAGAPALAVNLTIKDFPDKPTPAQLEAARRYMRIDAHGRGELTVIRCEEEDDGYLVHAPGLIAAMAGA